MDIFRNYPLKHLHTFGTDCYADTFCEIKTLRDLDYFFERYTNLPQPLLCIGGGSNLLFRKNFSGAVVKVSLRGRDIIQEDNNDVLIRLAAGENWHSVVEWTVDNNWGGIENLALIPGCCGAAPIQNIGAYGVELQQRLVSVEWREFSTNKSHTLDNEECRFGYRDSVFKHDLSGKGIITNITLRLSKNPEPNFHYADVLKELETLHINKPTIRNVFGAVVSIRSRKLPNPTEIGNAGSFFKNPIVSVDILQKLQEQFPEIPYYPQPDNTVKIPAGWLIEKAGWKGFRQGDAGVSPKQALVLVNYANATGDEIFQLSQNILDDVSAKFGIYLEREVNIS